jgi:cyclopropane fatty-acyl-phospholipid synthase-like methyltransferase
MEIMDDQERMAYFHEVFDASLKRLGPGDEASTMKALEVLRSAMARGQMAPASSELRIMDLGCGTGAQTLLLAQHLEGSITAVDNHPPFLAELSRRAKARGVSERITTRLQDLRTLELDEGSFDVIWCEGAMFCMGFRETLAACHRWLAPGGFLAASELCWLKPEPPAECRDHLTGAYPPIADVAACLSLIKAAGFTVLDHFTLPTRSWLEEFYVPLEERLHRLQRIPAENPARNEVFAACQKEIDMYRKYSEYFGYAFFIMQR